MLQRLRAIAARLSPSSTRIFGLTERLRFSTKLTLGFGAVCVILAATVGVGLVAIGALGGSVDTLVKDRHPKAALADAWTRSLLESSQHMRNALLFPDDSRIVAEIKATRADQEARAQYQARFAAMPKSADEQAQLDAVLKWEKTYTPSQEKFLTLIGNYDVDGATTELARSLDSLTNAYLGELNKLVQLEAKLADTASSAAHTEVRSAEALLALLGLAALLLAGGAGYLITRSVIRQIGGDPAVALDVARHITDGDLTRPIRVRADDDTSLLAAMNRMQLTLQNIVSAQHDMVQAHEAGQISHRIAAASLPGAYGEMAEGVNALAASHIAVIERIVAVVSQYAQGDFSLSMDALPGEKARITAAVEGIKASFASISTDVSALVDAAARGDFTARGDATRYQHHFRTMIEGLNSLMETARSGLEEIGRVLNAVANGDLSAQVEGEYAGTFGRLKDDTNQTVERLRDVIGQILSSAAAIRSAAGEILAGNNNLSVRTEQQAANLEETSASAEELASTVKASAEGAHDANNVANGAYEVASRGGSLASATVERMGAINASSRKVGDIIGVIDGIAFQTNILALNAAVEAARAGEQGRGFAVVASEVRALAQRSAAAAKDIKQLIEGSLEQIRSGTELARANGDNMHEIIQAVQRVNTIMSEIANNAHEQSAGIEQVARAVAEMDEHTQQNAALVEEAAAASKSLEDQAESLAQMVALFKLDERLGARERAGSGNALRLRSVPGR